MTPVIPTINDSVGGAAAVPLPHLIQIIQQLQKQPARHQHIPLYNNLLAQNKQQLQPRPIQNELNPNIEHALQGGASLAMNDQRKQPSFKTVI